MDVSQLVYLKGFSRYRAMWNFLCDSLFEHYNINVHVVTIVHDDIHWYCFSRDFLLSTSCLHGIYSVLYCI